jgi:hypothetical protein
MKLLYEIISECFWISVLEIYVRIEMLNEYAIYPELPLIEAVLEVVKDYMRK